MTFVGSSAGLCAAAEREVPFMVFVYDAGLVFARPTWGTLTATARDTAVLSGAADLALSVLSLVAPLNASGAAIGRGRVLRLMRQIRAAHVRFRGRAAATPLPDLAAELAAAGWRAIELPAGEIAGWSFEQAAGRRPGRVDIYDRQGRRYSLSGSAGSLGSFAQLLRGYPANAPAAPLPTTTSVAQALPMVASVPPPRRARAVLAAVVLAALVGTLVGRYALPAMPRGARMVVRLCGSSAADRAIPTCGDHPVSKEGRERVIDALRRGATVYVVGPQDTSDVLVAVLADPNHTWSRLQAALTGMPGVAAVLPACDGGPYPTAEIRGGCVDPYATPDWVFN
ncbi:hypothetical protein [Planotetraspora sp. GP83]|uniref:hypothetical protein n=1 Tax=Planotetraspora sp. GP83 TaxID=3156264 RepID=UPI003512E5CF